MSLRLSVLAVLVALASSLVVPQKAAVAGGMFCQICEDLLQGIETVGEGELESYIEQKGQELCSTLGPFADLCNQQVDKVSQDIIDLINQNFPPEGICAEVQLCNAAAKKLPVVPKAVKA